MDFLSAGTKKMAVFFLEGGGRYSECLTVY